MSEALSVNTFFSEAQQHQQELSAGGTHFEPGVLTRLGRNVLGNRAVVIGSDAIRNIYIDGNNMVYDGVSEEELVGTFKVVNAYYGAKKPLVGAIFEGIHLPTRRFWVPLDPTTTIGVPEDRLFEEALASEILACLDPDEGDPDLDRLAQLCRAVPESKKYLYEAYINNIARPHTLAQAFYFTFESKPVDDRLTVGKGYPTGDGFQEVQKALAGEGYEGTTEVTCFPMYIPGPGDTFAINADDFEDFAQYDHLETYTPPLSLWINTNNSVICLMPGLFGCTLLKPSN